MIWRNSITVVSNTTFIALLVFFLYSFFLLILFFCFGFRRAISVLKFGDSSLNSVLFTNNNHKDILKFCYTGLGTSVPF